MLAALGLASSSFLAAANRAPAAAPAIGFAIDNTAVTEPDAFGRTDLVFIVSTPVAPSFDCDLQASTLTTGTATDLIDYDGRVETLHLQAGQTSTTFRVNVNGDTTFEPNETVNVALAVPPVASSTPACPLGSPTQATGTIVDNDPAPTGGPAISIADASTLEGAPGNVRQLRFVVTPAAPITESCDFVATFAHGTTDAADVVDLLPVHLTFSPGNADRQVTLSIVGDATVEPNETLTATIAGETGTFNPCTIGDGTATGTIANDDPNAPPGATISIANASVVEGNTGTTSMAVTLTTPNAPFTFCSAVATITHITTNDADFVSSSLSQDVFFPALATSSTFFVNIAADTNIEPNETFTITLSINSQRDDTCTIGAASSATGTITDDDAGTPSLSIADASDTEGSGTGNGRNLRFVITATPAITTTCQVRVTRQNVTTTDADTVQIASQVLTITAGTTSRDVLVTTVPDLNAEPDETFTVTIAGTGATPCTIDRAVATGTIIDDDTTTGPPKLALTTNQSVTEGTSTTTFTTISFLVVLATPGALPAPCGVRITLTHGTTDAADFVSTAPIDLTISGTAANSITYQVVGDSVVEPDETFTVTMTGNGATPCSIANGAQNGTGTGTILNDDAAPPPPPATAVSIGNAQRVEGSSPNTFNIFNFPITLSGTLTAPCGLRATITHVSTDDADFAAPAPQDVTVLGSSTGFSAFAINGDTVVEPDETFTVTIAGRGATPCAIGTATATGTIVNDDTPPPPPPVAEQLYATSVVPPATIAIGTQYAVETAQRVNVNCAGTIGAIWWYRTAADVGLNTVSLWKGTTLVAQAAANPGATGWVRVTFAPVTVAPGDQLLVGVHHPNGAYGYRLNGFSNRSINSLSGCLVAPATTTSAKTGLYKYTPTPALPDLSYEASEYFISPELTPGVGAPTTTAPPPPPPPVGHARLYADSVVPPATIAIGSQFAVETAQLVDVSCNGRVNGIWWFKTAQDTGTQTVTLWRGTTQLATASGSPASTSGWVLLTFTTPVTVTAGAKNGRYSYSPTPVVPTLSYADSEYFISPDFTQTS